MMYPQYNNQYQQQPYQQAGNGNYYQGAMQAQAPMQTQIPNQLTIQNGGFVSAPNIDYVLNYPVAHGNCVTFKLENQPIVMEKSLGFSQLEAPIIKRYRLVEEETEETTDSSSKDTNNGYDDEEIKAQIDDLKSEIIDLKKQIKALQGTKNKKLVKQILVDEEEDEQDDTE